MVAFLEESLAKNFNMGSGLGFEFFRGYIIDDTFRLSAEKFKMRIRTPHHSASQKNVLVSRLLEFQTSTTVMSLSVHDR